MIFAQSIVWDPNPILLPLGSLNISYYGLFFSSGFLIGQQILFHIFKNEGKPEKDVELLTIYMVVATIIGARLGHVFFYEPATYLADPIKILKINEGGLASHGATIGILIALYLYAKRKKDQSYLWVLDRLVIVIALAGCFIRLGNFINSEIIGLPTGTDKGVVFARHIEEAITFNFPEIVEAEAFKRDGEAQEGTGYVPVGLELTFIRGQYEEDAIRSYIEHSVKNLLVTYNSVDEPHTYVDPALDLDYSLSQTNGQYMAIVDVWGMPRHPAQLYESFSCLILFFILFGIWRKMKGNMPEGLLFGIFLIIVFGLRILYEFLKENQVDFEDGLALNMGQWLSIPLFIAGIVIVVFVTRGKRKQKEQDA